MCVLWMLKYHVKFHLNLILIFFKKVLYWLSHLEEVLMLATYQFQQNETEEVWFYLFTLY